MENLIDDYVTQGYAILEQSERNAMVRKKNSGSMMIHIILFLFTVGVGNVIYYFLAQNNAEKVMIKVDGES
ncbi:hypothetical protein [Desulfamplus magnetovallimortis]|nr:hypothetical protein [Desulfamplus magnetovallimortis]